MDDLPDEDGPAEARGLWAHRVADELEWIAIGAVGLTTRALSRAGAGIDLTFPQWRAILIVGEDGDGVRVGEVAARVGVTLPATSRLLRRLERRGLVSLGEDATDHRATRARLTDRGLLIRSAILSHRRAAIDDIVARLPDPGRMGLAEGLSLIAAEFERTT